MKQMKIIDLKKLLEETQPLSTPLAYLDKQVKYKLSRKKNEGERK